LRHVVPVADHSLPVVFLVAHNAVHLVACDHSYSICLSTSILNAINKLIIFHI
jgi:hypothetical protein